MGEAIFQYARRGDLVSLKEELQAPGADPDDFFGADGSSALIMACKQGNIDCVQVLVDAGASLELTTDELSNCLHHSVNNQDGDEKSENAGKIVKLLIEKFKSNPTGPLSGFIDAENEDMFTPLHLACYYGRLNVVKNLIELGSADVYKLDEDGADPLGICEKRGHDEVAKYLLTKIDSETRTEKLKGGGGGAKEKITEKFGYGCFDGEEVPS